MTPEMYDFWSGSISADEENKSEDEDESMRLFTLSTKSLNTKVKKRVSSFGTIGDALDKDKQSKRSLYTNNRAKNVA
jgi:hypothetical protein